MDVVGRASQVLKIEIDALARIRDSLGESFEQAVELMVQRLESGGKIVVTGIGKSLHIAEKLSATLASTGSTSVVLNPSQAMHGDFGILLQSDVLLALSYSGESDELVAIIPVVKRLGVPIVALTGIVDSTLGRNSDVVVPVTVEREACPFNMAPTSSTTVTLAMGDALAMVLLEARGFKEEDYAKLHPGGAIGRALLTRVQDIMRSGDALAAVPETASIRDAVLSMTRARSGSVGIVDGSKRLLGIFTDGDLRRHVTDDPEVLRRPVADVMTRDPITVRADQLAVEVLRIYESHRIDDLLVIDKDGALVGVIDIQDLPKMKIL